MAPNIINVEWVCDISTDQYETLSALMQTSSFRDLLNYTDAFKIFYDIDYFSHYGLGDEISKVLATSIEQHAAREFGRLIYRIYCSLDASYCEQHKELYGNRKPESMGGNFMAAYDTFRQLANDFYQHMDQAQKIIREGADLRRAAKSKPRDDVGAQAKTVDMSTDTRRKFAAFRKHMGDLWGGSEDNEDIKSIQFAAEEFISQQNKT